jgi:cold shock protein
MPLRSALPNASAMLSDVPAHDHSAMWWWLMATGKIAVFDAVKGCGLIAPDDGGSRVFVHAEEFGGDQDLGTGTPVRFSSIQGARGLRAYNVAILNGSSRQRRGPQVRVEPHNGCTVERNNDCSSGTITTHEEEQCLSHEFQLLSRNEYLTEITDILISIAPDITARQILKIRIELARRAARRSWIGSR